MNTVMGGHKVPVSSLSLAVYFEEAVRALYPEAQQAANTMFAEYVGSFGQSVPEWVRSAREMNKGFRPPKMNPIATAYIEKEVLIDNSLARGIRANYVRDWLLDHPVADVLVGFSLVLGSLAKQQLIPDRAAKQAKSGLVSLLAERSGLDGSAVRALLQARRTAQALLKEKVGAYPLAQERRLMRAALVFAARYVTGSGPKKHRTWDEAIGIVENDRTLLSSIGSADVHYDPSDAMRAARPFIKTFVQPDPGQTLQPRH